MSSKSELETFFGALRFFTRLPIPGSLGQSEEALERAMRYLPAVGLIVGLLSGLTFAITTFFWPKTLAVLAAMVTAILVTGALHEDGWCDMVDGFGGGRDKDSILSIMRDSHIGSFGMLAMTVLLLVRFLALVEVDIQFVPIALIAGHAVSRLCVLVTFSLLDYARPEGKVQPFNKELGSNDIPIAGVIALLPVLLLGPAQFIPALILAALATFYLVRLFKRKIGGYTGDCLGSVQQLSEVAFYCGLLCSFS